jgi:hypothetical protein
MITSSAIKVIELHLLLGCVTVRVGPGLGVGEPGPDRSGPKKQSLNPDQKPGRSGPGPRPGCQEFQEMPRLVLAAKYTLALILLT